MQRVKKKRYFIYFGIGDTDGVYKKEYIAMKFFNCDSANAWYDYLIRIFKFLIQLKEDINIK